LTKRVFLGFSVKNIGGEKDAKWRVKELDPLPENLKGVRPTQLIKRVFLGFFGKRSGGEALTGRF
jgi:hypothetical protein